MNLCSRDIMVTSFDKIHENALVSKAMEMISNGRIRETGHKTISLLVVNDFSQYVGVITLFDILYHLRPSYLNYGVDSEHIDWEGQLESIIHDLKDKKVKQIMSSALVFASPDEHIMVVLDRMIKNKYRRLPILENNRAIGVVYISDIFYHLFKKTT